MKRSLLLTFFGLLSVLLVSSASAQVLVYKLKFEETGPKVNYESYDEGYFVLDGFSGDGTVILMVRDRGFRYYVEISNGGEIFLVQDGSKRVAVFRAFGGNTNSAVVAYQAVGNMEGSQKLGGGFAARIARKLEGYLLASDEENDAVQDDETDDDFDDTVGFAGSSEMIMRWDKGKTREYNEQLLSASEAVDEIIAELERHGYQEEPDDNQVPDPGGSDDD